MGAGAGGAAIGSGAGAVPVREEAVVPVQALEPPVFRL